MSPADVLAWPAGLPLLLGAPLVWLGLSRGARSRARAREALLGPRARLLVPPVSARRGPWRRVVLVLTLAAGTLALLGPLGAERPERLERRGVDLVVGLDVSRSMLAQDVAPSRLARAQAEVRALAERAAQDRVGLVLFAGEARAAVPLTEDRAALADLAELADPSSVVRGGTDLAAAIDAALALLPAASDVPGVIVLVSDGEDHGGRGRAAAERARERGVTVHALGVGTREGGRIAVPGDEGPTYLRDAAGREVLTALDPAGLLDVARAGGGVYAAAAEPGALVTLYEQHVEPAAARALTDARRASREDLFACPLAAAVALGCLALVLGGRRL